MTSRHLVDPQLLSLLDLWPAVTLDAATLPLLRAPGRLPLGTAADDDGVARTDTACPGRDGAPDVPLIVYRPAGCAGEALPCILHIHGGGYVAGSAAAMEPLHRALVAALGCALVTVAYRLAPETPYPGALEDCYAALDHIVRHAATLAIDPARIGVSGESAGGGLAAALALLARDRGEHRLAFQHLIYPMLDDRTCIAADPHPFAGGFVWTAASNAFAWQAYLGMAPGGPDVPAHAAAARATDLAGLPPTFIATGALDLFVDEDMAYAARLIRAGVPTDLHVHAGVFHAGDLDPVADVAARMRRDSRDFLTRHLAAAPRTKESEA